LVELTMTVERPPEGAGASWPRALLLGRRGDGAAAAVSALVAAFQELETVAGVRPAHQLGLGPTPALPGLDPATPLAVVRHLDAACRRGLPTPRPRRTGDRRAAEAWMAGPGAALDAWSSAGRSVQAVVALSGSGDPAVLAPRPGGAVVLRAWRVGHAWGALSALVLGAADARELGREATSVARHARAGGWEAAVLRGAAAMGAARAGDPRQPIPTAAARGLSEEELAALVAACSAAGARPAWARPSGREPLSGSPARRRARLARILDEPEEPSPPLPVPPGRR